MAVSFFNASSTAGGASAAARTLQIVGTVNACLVVYTIADSSVSLSAMAAGTNPMTFVTAVSAGSIRQELWVLSNVPTGTLTISAIPVGVATTKWAMAAAVYTGHRQIGGSMFGTAVIGTATAATSNLSVSSTSTDLVSFGFGISANTSVVFNNGTTRASATASTGVRLVIGDIAGATATSISATAGAGTPVWGMIGIPIIASPTAVTTISFDNARATGTSVARNTASLLLTATAGACLIVFTNVDGGSQTISSIAIGATQLTFKGAVNWRAAAARRSEVWVLTAPPSGTLTISAAIVGAATSSLNLYGVTYTGHKTTADPFGGLTLGSGSSTAVVSVIVSCTAGNVGVIGFFAEDQTLSSGAGLNQRIESGAYMHGIIADTPGQAALTASAFAGAVQYWGMIGLNLIQSGAASFVSANIAMTDVADTFTATAQVRVTGRLSATDATDKFTATAQVRVTGSFAATDTPDKFTATAAVRVTARLSATDVGDVFTSTGNVRVTGRLSATDVADVFVATAFNRVTGRLSATDAADTFSASAQVRVTGRISATDVADTFTATANRLNDYISASIAFTDRPDIFAATANVVPESVAAVVVVQDLGSGGGYQQAGDSYWDAREAYLRGLQSAIEEPVLIDAPPHSVEVPNVVPSPVNPLFIVQYRQARQQTVKAIEAAPDLRSLYREGERLRRINRALREIDANLQAAARDHFEALGKRRQRNRLIRRAKQKAALTAAYILAQTLQFPPRR